MKKVFKRILTIICFVVIMMTLNCGNVYADIVTSYTDYKTSYSFFMPIIIVIIVVITLSTMVLIRINKKKMIGDDISNEEEVKDNERNG